MKKQGCITKFLNLQELIYKSQKPQGIYPSGVYTTKMFSYKQCKCNLALWDPLGPTVQQCGPFDALFISLISGIMLNFSLTKVSFAVGLNLKKTYAIKF